MRQLYTLILLILMNFSMAAPVFATTTSTDKNKAAANAHTALQDTAGSMLGFLQGGIAKIVMIIALITCLLMAATNMKGGMFLIFGLIFAMGLWGPHLIESAFPCIL